MAHVLVHSRANVPVAEAALRPLRTRSETAIATDAKELNSRTGPQCLLLSIPQLSVHQGNPAQ